MCLIAAYHLVTCSKQTAYSKKPEQKFFEYDDELEEFNPFEPYGDGKSRVPSCIEFTAATESVLYINGSFMYLFIANDFTYTFVSGTEPSSSSILQWPLFFDVILALVVGT